MSNSVSALRGAVAPGEVTVREGGLQGMITLRGDLSNAKLKSVCKAVTGAMFPKMGQATMSGDNALAWMSPDEALILVPHADTADAIAKIDKALKGQHYLAENLSDARALSLSRAPIHARSWRKPLLSICTHQRFNPVIFAGPAWAKWPPRFG